MESKILLTCFNCEVCSNVSLVVCYVYVLCLFRQSWNVNVTRPNSVIIYISKNVSPSVSCNMYWNIYSWSRKVKLEAFEFCGYLLTLRQIYVWVSHCVFNANAQSGNDMSTKKGWFLGSVVVAWASETFSGQWLSHTLEGYFGFKDIELVN